MCPALFKKKKMETPKPPAVLPQPEKVAEPEEVGAARKAEDEQLFGETGTPQLRTDRSAVSGGIASSGTGLRMT